MTNIFSAISERTREALVARFPLMEAKIKAEPMDGHPYQIEVPLEVFIFLFKHADLGEDFDETLYRLLEERRIVMVTTEQSGNILPGNSTVN